MLKRIFLYTGNQDMKFDYLPRGTASAGSKFSNIYMLTIKQVYLFINITKTKHHSDMGPTTRDRGNYCQAKALNRHDRIKRHTRPLVNT